MISYKLLSWLLEEFFECDVTKMLTGEQIKECFLSLAGDIVDSSLYLAVINAFFLGRRSQRISRELTEHDWEVFKFADLCS